MQQNKILLIILAVAAAIIIIGYGAWKFFGVKSQPTMVPQSTSQGQAPAPQPGGTEATSTYGTLPEIESVTNPLEEKPDLNPVDRANPFKDIYKNPFE